MPYIYPPALQRPGPRGKLWLDPNLMNGVILHSAEGYEAGLWSQLDNVDVDSQGNYLIPASWHFSIMYDGRVFQHYPINESPWHAGSRAWNTRLIGIEHEGVAGEPLTPDQQNESFELVMWIAQQGLWTPSRDIYYRTLYEHNEVNPQTDCPSERIDWNQYMTNPNPPRRPDITNDNDVRAWLLPLSNMQLLSPLRWEVDNQGRQMAVYETKVYLP